MLAFIVSRLLQSLAVMLAVSFLCFVLFDFAGDPVNDMVGREASPSERAEMRHELGLEALRTDYIRFARARGLTDHAVHFRHALKNTLLPVIIVIGIRVGGLIAFSIITETVFQWPGMGQLFIQSVQFADIPVMAAYLVMVSLLFVTINFFVDRLYAAIDPRLRLDRAQLGTAGG
jgi:ABC-type dipeptide/oligopeptide/nickel transport system permease component